MICWRVRSRSRRLLQRFTPLLLLLLGTAGFNGLGEGKTPPRQTRHIVPGIKLPRLRRFVGESSLLTLFALLFLPVLLELGFLT